MRKSRSRVLFLPVVAMLIAGALSACTGPATTAIPSPERSGALSQKLVLTAADSGRTVTVSTKERVLVVLSGSDWIFTPATPPTILRSQQINLRSTSANTSCPPGVGCGSVASVFQALKPGRAQVTATRKNCGEAMPCTPQNTRFHVTITVRIGPPEQ